jgi:predicted nucleic acid-binding protein
MIVVADTTPLNYLILIDEVELLPILFGPVLLPLAAFEELQHAGTPLKVREWMAHPPDWVEVRSVSTPLHPMLTSLDPGEREAIQLALDLGIGTVLMDEAEGRQVAEALHLEVRGTLGILERAAKLGKLDLRPALDKLQQTNFRISPSFLASFLKRNL